MSRDSRATLSNDEMDADLSDRVDRSSDGSDGRRDRGNGNQTDDDPDRILQAEGGQNTVPATSAPGRNTLDPPSPADPPRSVSTAAVIHNAPQVTDSGNTSAPRVYDQVPYSAAYTQQNIDPMAYQPQQWQSEYAIMLQQQHQEQMQRQQQQAYSEQQLRIQQQQQQQLAYSAYIAAIGQAGTSVRQTGYSQTTYTAPVTTHTTLSPTTTYSVNEFGQPVLNRPPPAHMNNPHNRAPTFPAVSQPGAVRASEAQMSMLQQDPGLPNASGPDSRHVHYPPTSELERAAPPPPVPHSGPPPTEIRPQGQGHPSQTDPLQVPTSHAPRPDIDPRYMQQHAQRPPSPRRHPSNAPPQRSSVMTPPTHWDARQWGQPPKDPPGPQPSYHPSAQTTQTQQGSHPSNYVPPSNIPRSEPDWRVQDDNGYWRYDNNRRNPSPDPPPRTRHNRQRSGQNGQPHQVPGHQSRPPTSLHSIRKSKRAPRTGQAFLTMTRS